MTRPPASIRVADDLRGRLPGSFVVAVEDPGGAEADRRQALA